MGKRHSRHSLETKRAALAEYMAGMKVAEICRRYEISSGMLYYWKRRSDKGLLDGNPNKETVLEKRVAELERMIGRLTMENELLKKQGHLCRNKSGEKKVYCLLQCQALLSQSRMRGNRYEQKKLLL